MNYLGKILNKRAFRLFAIAGLVSYIAFHAGSSRTASPQLPKLPPAGIAENDTRGTVPGEISNGIEDLKKIGKIIEIYKTRNGQYPPNLLFVFKDIQKDSRSYGFDNPKESEPIFLNPDTRFSDSVYERENSDTCPYFVTDVRPDGTKVGNFKSSSKRDVIASTSLYIHNNNRRYESGRTTANPVGVFLVLWDDGQVEQVPYDKQLFVPQRGGKFLDAFPGQAGVPDNALTYDEFYQSVGAKKGPRGGKGGKGKSYKNW